MTDGLKIAYLNQDETWCDPSRQSIERAAHLVWAEMASNPARDAELSVVLCDDAYIRDLNRDWRGKDKPTNVLSFPGSDENDDFPDRPVLLGDIILAHETIIREAKDQSKPFFNHLMHLVVHGFLHLLGYDHIEDDEAEEMEALEVKILAKLGIDDPYILPVE